MKVTCIYRKMVSEKKNRMHLTFHNSSDGLLIKDQRESIQAI